MGLQAYFYDNYTEDNLYNNAPPIPPDRPVVFSIPVATVDQDYDLYPMPGLVDDFVVKYEGYITATESATVNLQCLADDGCIVIIDGVTIIDEWWDKGTDGGVYEYTLVPNQSLSFTVWYYENGGGAVIQLRWQLEGGDWSVVPESVFSTVVKDIVIVNPTPIQQDTETTQTVTETSTSIVDSPTVETLTPLVPSDTQTSNVEPSETETAPSESSTQTIPIETITPIVETPLPTPVPSPVVVQPEPARPIESQVPEIQPEPQPELEPEPSEPEIDTEPPLEEPEEELPVDEPQLPDEEVSEYPEEEDTNEIPSVPEILEPIEPTPEPLPQPVVEPEPTFPPDIAPEPPVVSESMVTLDNGVVLTEEEAAAVVLLSNPVELLSELFTDPGAVFAALGSVGADMTPEEREKSEKVVVSAIIAGGIATQSAAVAAGAAAYRRKP